MIALSLAEIAEIVDGRVVDAAPEQTVTAAVVTDSREATVGGLFVARIGATADGHDFAGEALRRGVTAVLAARPIGGPAVLVADTEVALAVLARAIHDRVPGLVTVGVTGSSGKTSTKDLLADVLAGRGPLVAPPGSYNTDVGVALTLARLTHDTTTLIVEMGARGPGHIARLTRLAPPDVAVVLNVGSAHLGEFGGREQIAAAKSELVRALETDGVAVLNADDPVVRAMAELSSGRVVLVGESADSDVRAEGVVVDDHGRPAFTLSTPRGRARVQLQLVGEHHVANALAAAGVADILGVDVEEIATRLSDARPRSRWRMEVSHRADGLTVVNDAYNANPESARVALRALKAMAAGRRTWAVLGEMAEIGPTSTEEHDALGRLAVRLDINRLVVVGAAARPIHLGAVQEGSFGQESSWVPDIDAALDMLRAEVTETDVVLVKASRSVGLERVAAALLEGGPQ